MVVVLEGEEEESESELSKAMAIRATRLSLGRDSE